jgi:hypothetical protein
MGALPSIAGVIAFVALVGVGPAVVLNRPRRAHQSEQKEPRP